MSESPLDPLDAQAVWRFEESGGATAVDSAGAHDATMRGGVQRIGDGRFGGAMRFDGAGDWLDATLPMAGAVAASVEAWIRTTAQQSNGYIVSIPRTSNSNNGFDLNVAGGSVRSFLVANGFVGAQAAQPYADGAWHHVATVYDGGRLRLYWEGAEVDSMGITGTLATDHDQVNIGRFGTGGGEFLGDIDDVAVYRRALSAQEVEAHAQQGVLAVAVGDACDLCPLSAEPACEPLNCLDGDADGHGARGASHCPGGLAFDCDDADPTVHPGAVEACNLRDDDCDLRIDDGCPATAQTTTYAYNAFNQLTALTGPLGTTSFAYDLNGNQLTKDEPTGTTSYAYDARERLVEATVLSGVLGSCTGDTDCDGVPNTADNCPLVGNAEQEDGVSVLGRVSVWRFEEPTGSTALDSAGTNHGTLVGGATRSASGRLGQALLLNGATGEMRLPTQPVTSLFGAPFTWMLYAQSSAADQPTWGFVGSDGSNTQDPFASYASGLNFGNGVGGYQLVPPVPPAAPSPSWTHYAVSSDGTTYRVYVDGTLVSSSAVSVHPASATARTFTLGQSGFDGEFAQYFGGKIDEVALYDRALTAPEVQELATVGLGGDDDGVGDACDPCPTSPDPACGTTSCTDADGDGYGIVGAAGCSAGTALDCDDALGAVHPGAVEELNGRDDDCDGRIDDGTERAVMRYGYDTQGLRVRVQDASGTRRVLLDGIEELAEYDAGSGVQVARYDHDLSRVDGLLGQLTAQGKVHAVTDALGSVYGLTDGGGEAVTRYGYDVYGQRSSSTEAVATKFGFTGRVHETGIAGGMYYRARYLDNGTGRWNAADPSGMPDGPNMYWYVRGNPIVSLDPFGLRTLVITGSPVFPTYKHQAIEISHDLWRKLLKDFVVREGRPDVEVRTISAAWELTHLAMQMQVTELSVYDEVLFIGHAIVCDPNRPLEACGAELLNDVLTPKSFGAFLEMAGVSSGKIVNCGNHEGSGEIGNPVLESQIERAGSGVRICFAPEAAKFGFKPPGQRIPDQLSTITGEVSGFSFPGNMQCVGP